MPEKAIVGTYTKGHAHIKIKLSGVSKEPMELLALLDTGFTGFVHLPMQYAFALGLPLIGTVTSTLADARRVTEFTTIGIVSINGLEKTGVVVLASGAKEVLVGMNFLQTFRLGLYLTGEDVLLFEDEDEDAAAN